MSVEEDSELKNLVAQTLENKGVLPKIRAELRANVFLALEENPSTKETLLKNDELATFVKIPTGSLILNLIREFLEFFELEFTLSVFDPETKYGKEYISIGREKMMEDLKITNSNIRNPLLFEVINRLIDSDDLKDVICVKSLKELDNNNISIIGNAFSSPNDLNCTFVKEKSEVNLIPVEKECSKDDENESIKEELISNIHSESDNTSKLDLHKNIIMANAQPATSCDCNSTDSKSDTEKSAEMENGEIISEDNSYSEDSKQNITPKNPLEIDLLTFTPVKETKMKEKSESSEVKTDDKKQKQKLISVLGDLPPLTLKTDEKENKMNEIKAMIDRWPGSENEEEFSIESKSNKGQTSEEKLSGLKSYQSDYSHFSQKSEKTDVADDFDEDLSDLINGHTSSDKEYTVDETISKTSQAADYLESL